MKIPSIFVGCGPFGLQRLKVLIEKTNFLPIACVDKNTSNAKKKLSEDDLTRKLKLHNNVFSSIDKALKSKKAKACFIFVAADQHANLVIQSLKNNMHTYCVKPVAMNKKEFKKVYSVAKNKKDLQFLQGYNNQWNEAATRMHEIINKNNTIGKIIGGQCICWGRQNLKLSPPHIEVKKSGMFFLALACHQLSQLVTIAGLPEYVTSYVHNKVDKDIGQSGVFGTSGGQCIFEYPGKIPFSYSGTRAAHGNPYGFASRWSGQWIIHGEKGDIKRDGGRITVYKNGQVVSDNFLKDLDDNLLKDEEIQFLKFHEMIKFSKDKKNTFKKIHNDSINTWILMEACNESAKLNKKISLKSFKNSLLGKN
jgi:predicted dehydrogenase